MSFFLETKQQSQATAIENLKSETGWEFTVLLIKKKECNILSIDESTTMELVIILNEINGNSCIMI